jgi:hypothetical protein
MLAAEVHNLLLWHVLDRERHALNHLPRQHVLDRERHALDLSRDGYGPQVRFLTGTEVFARALLLEIWCPLVEVEQKTSNPVQFIRVRVLDLRFDSLFR